MPTSYRPTRSAAAVLCPLFLLLACSVPLSAQDIFVISEVQESRVLITPLHPGAKDAVPPVFVRFEVFDVYAVLDPLAGLVGYVDSLYFNGVSTDGISTGYVWRGERKFLKKDLFAVRTGRIYQVEEKGTAAAQAPGPTGAAIRKSSLPGSFGVEWLEVALSAGTGGGGAGAYSMILAAFRVRYTFLGISVRCPLPTAIGQFTEVVSGYVDLYWDILPFWTVFGSVGISQPDAYAPNFSLGAATIVCFPVFGPRSSFMPFLELAAYAPNSSGARPYLAASVGVRF